MDDNIVEQKAAPNIMHPPKISLPDGISPRITAAEAMPENWVNLEDIADHLSVSTDTVRNWIKDGKLPFYKAGKRYKFKISEVDAWLRDGKISD